jgi:hypothetical protein
MSKDILFKVRPTQISGVYGCGDYEIRVANKSGGKAGRGNNITSTLRVISNDSINGGYRIEKQFRFTVGNKDSYDKAEKKCVLWIMQHPKTGQIK